MNPGTIKTAKGMLIGVAFGAMSLGIMAQPVEAERNPCDLLQRELNARGTHGREVEPFMNLIACGDDWDTGTWREDTNNPCQVSAYRAAQRLMPGGLLVDLHRVGIIVDAQLNQGPDGEVCVVEEDWAWSHR